MAESEVPEVDVEVEVDATAVLEAGPAVAERFGPYELMGTIAAGGMAELFLALKEEGAGVRKSCALKRILPHLTGSEGGEFVRLFMNEARLSVRLEHPNIVRVTEFGQVSGQYYLAMEYLAGEDLQRVIRNSRKREQPCPVDIAVAICEQVASGLAYAHGLTDEKGEPLRLIHRDVTPSNVILTYQGVTKLVDFGIARVEGVAGQTKTGAVRGKVAYLAPECFLGQPVDGRADVWSVGCLLWELLTGERTFRADSDAGVMGLVVTGTIPFLGDVAPHLDPALVAIVQRCLAREPAQRFGSAAELCEALDTFLENNGGRPSARRIASWLIELFGAERATAKLDVASCTRLDSSLPKVLQQLSRAATGSREAKPPTHTTATRAHSQRKGPLVAGVAAVLLCAAGLAVALGRDEATPAPTAEAAQAGRLRVESTPPGALLFLDGSMSGLRTPAVLPSVTIGKPLRVRVELPGYQRLERTVSPVPGEQLEVFHLQRATLKLRVEGLPAGATLLVDGEPVEVDAAGEVEVVLGQRTFQRREGGQITGTTRADITAQSSVVSMAPPSKQ